MRSRESKAKFRNAGSRGRSQAAGSAEVGTDLTKWRTEKHFTSWMGLAPGSHQSGKRHRPVKRSRNRAGRLFCMMALSLARSKDIALGGFYRRMAARRGGLVANKALARKLAALFWRVMVKGVDYVERPILRLNHAQHRLVLHGCVTTQPSKLVKLL